MPLKDFRIEVCFNSYALYRLSRYQLTAWATESCMPARPTRESHTDFRSSITLNSVIYWIHADWPWWLTYRRPRTLPARPVYSLDKYECQCDSANVTSFHNVKTFNTFSTANANGIGVWLFFHTESSTEFFHTPIIYGNLDGAILSRC